LVVAAVCSLATPASAQLPLPGFGEDGALNVRFASTDAILDEARSLAGRLERARKEREPAIVDAKRTLEADVRTWTARPDVEGPVRPPTASTMDKVRLAQRLIAAYDAELSMLADGVATAGRAVRAAEAKSDPVPSANLDELIAADVASRAARGRWRAAEATSERLRTLVSGAGPKPGTKPSVEDRLIAQEWRVQVAEADRAQAQALELRATARQLAARVDAALPELSVSAEGLAVFRAELGQTRAEHETEQTRIDSARAGLEDDSGRSAERTTAARKARRALTLEELELLDVRGMAMEASLARARARMLLATALTNHQPLQMTGDLAPAVIVSRLGEFEQRRSKLDALDVELERALADRKVNTRVGELLQQRRDAVIEQRRVLTGAAQALATVQTIHSLGARVSEAPAASTFGWPEAIWTLLVAILATLLFFHGLSLVSLVLAFIGRTTPIRKRRLTQIETGVSLLWPLIILLGAAAVVVWPIFDLDVTFLEAVQLFDKPLFYVEDNAVSVFSVVQLVLAIWVSVVLSRVVRDLLSRRVYERIGWDIGLITAFDTMIHYTFLLTGVLLGLRFVGIGLQSLAIFAGVLGIGIGFGLRNVTENFISGLIILAERPIKIGDFIEVAQNAEGRVEQIRARSTTVVTRDNISVIIPNSEFVSGRVTNWSHGDTKVRIRVDVGVAYGSDTDLARKVLLEVAGRHGQVLRKPPPEVYFTAFGASSLDFTLLVWIDEQAHRFRIASDLHFAVDKAFRRHRIEIAFPQLDLHFKTAGGGFVSSVRAGFEPRDEAETLLPERASELPGPNLPGSTLPGRRPRKG